MKYIYFNILIYLSHSASWSSSWSGFCFRWVFIIIIIIIFVFFRWARFWSSGRLMQPCQYMRSQVLLSSQYCQYFYLVNILDHRYCTQRCLGLAGSVFFGKKTLQKYVFKASLALNLIMGGSLRAQCNWYFLGSINHICSRIAEACAGAGIMRIALRFFVSSQNIWRKNKNTQGSKQTPRRRTTCWPCPPCSPSPPSASTPSSILDSIHRYFLFHFLFFLAVLDSLKI